MEVRQSQPASLALQRVGAGKRACTLLLAVPLLFPCTFSESVCSSYPFTTARRQSVRQPQARTSVVPLEIPAIPEATNSNRLKTGSPVSFALLIVCVYPAPANPDAAQRTQMLAAAQLRRLATAGRQPAPLVLLQPPAAGSAMAARTLARPRPRRSPRLPQPQPRPQPQPQPRPQPQRPPRPHPRRLLRPQLRHHMT